MDKLIKHFNEKYGPNVTLMYSTPSMYIYAINSLNVSWPTKYDDMFPYADDQYSFWTGYFTSRPNDKEYIRKASHNLHASNKLYALKMLEQSVSEQTVEQILHAKEVMMDVMGVN